VSIERKSTERASDECVPVEYRCIMGK
jgi:hypothetical protein